MYLCKRWMVVVVQTSEWSRPEPGPKPSHPCTPPASWLQQSTAPSSDSSRGRTWAGRTQLPSTGLRQRDSEHRQCDHSPTDHEAKTQPGEASGYDLQTKTTTNTTFRGKGMQRFMSFNQQKPKTNNVLVHLNTLTFPYCVCGIQPRGRWFLLQSLKTNHIFFFKGSVIFRVP